MPFIPFVGPHNRVSIEDTEDDEEFETVRNLDEKNNSKVKTEVKDDVDNDELGIHLPQKAKD